MRPSWKKRKKRENDNFFLITFFLDNHNQEKLYLDKKKLCMRLSSFYRMTPSPRLILKPLINETTFEEVKFYSIEEKRRRGRKEGGGKRDLLDL